MYKNIFIKVLLVYVRTVQRPNRASNKCCGGHLRTLRGGGYVAQVVLYNNYTSINRSSGVALVLKSIRMFRDPLDQYSEWLCNKCDFSLEVSMPAKMLGQSVYNLFFDNMTIFHLVCCLSRCLVRVVKICFSTI